MLDAVGWTTLDGAPPVDATDWAASLDTEALEAGKVADGDAMVGSTLSLVTAPVDATDTGGLETVEEEGGVVEVELVRLCDALLWIVVEAEATVGVIVVEGDAPVKAAKKSARPEGVVES